MGWSTGSMILSGIIKTIERNVEHSVDRQEIYEDLIDIFEDYDCDTLDECLGESEEFDLVYKSMYSQDPE